jgi:hypothetical protein
MKAEAARAGFYASPWTCLQCLTIADLLAGKKIDYPSYSANVTFKQAPKTRTTCAKERPPNALYIRSVDQRVDGQLPTQEHSSLYVNSPPVLRVSQVPLTPMVSP